MKYAILKNGTVANIAEAGEAFALAQGWVLATEGATIGATWDGVAFTPPAPPAPEPLEIDTWQFFALFTPAEVARYFTANAAGNVGVRTMREILLMNAGGKFSGDHPMIQNGLAMLRNQGVIDNDARRDELLAYLSGA